MALYKYAGFDMHVFLVTIGLSVISMIGFLSLHRRIERGRN